MTTQSPKLIVVLGAGIVGLQTALSLRKAGYEAVIVVQHFPGDEDARLYTSPWAGAQWRTHAGVEDKEQQGWDIETYKQWMEDVKAGNGEEESGLAVSPSSSVLDMAWKALDRVLIRGWDMQVYPSHLYWPSPAPPTAASHWWSAHVLSFDEMPVSSLPLNTGITSGVSFTTITVNVPRHLSYLLSQFRSTGGSILRASLPSTGGLANALDFAEQVVRKHKSGDIHAFVNATGLGARGLVPDEQMYPTRGQTILVKGEAEKVSTFEGIDSIRYVIPRKGSGTSVLGGTKQAGNWDTEVDHETTRQILEGCKPLAPELLTDGEFEVLKVQVGLRPSRGGGARVESEIVGAKLVVHAYGHAGAGYQNSVGSANKVLNLIMELEQKPEALAKL